MASAGWRTGESGGELSVRRGENFALAGEGRSRRSGEIWADFDSANSRLTIPLTEVEANYALAPFMKVVSSIKSAKKRHPACQVVRRKGKIYVINKVEPRYKARQG